MKNEDYVAYCGLYCKLCGKHQDIPKRSTLQYIKFMVNHINS